MSECVGVKPICPNGQSAVCVKGEWVCQGVAIEEKENVEQSTSYIDGSEGADSND